MDNTEWVMPLHIVAAAGIVINEKDEVLMIKNPRRGWEFPGGQVEVGENLMDAINSLDDDDLTIASSRRFSAG